MNSVRPLLALFVLLPCISPYAFANPVSDADLNRPFIFVALFLAVWYLLLLWAGGFFHIRKRRAYFSDQFYIVAVSVLAMLSIAFFAPATVMLAVVVGTAHGIEMLVWAIRVKYFDRPCYLENAKPGRLVITGLGTMCPFCVILILFIFM